MKEEFEWYAEHGKNDITYTVVFISAKGVTDHTLLDICDSEDSDFKGYVKRNVKEVIQISQLPDIEKAVTKLIFDMVELKRTNRMVKVYCPVCNKEDGKGTVCDEIMIILGQSTYKLSCGHIIDSGGILNMKLKFWFDN